MMRRVAETFSPRYGFQTFSWRGLKKVVIGHSSVQTGLRVSLMFTVRSLRSCTPSTRKRVLPMRLSQQLKCGRQSSSLKRRLVHHTCFTRMRVTRRVTRRTWVSLRVQICAQRLLSTQTRMRLLYATWRLSPFPSMLTRRRRLLIIKSFMKSPRLLRRTSIVSLIGTSTL